MKEKSDTWDVRLTNAALSDYREILLWTRQHFGERQAGAYADILDDALAELSDGPALAGARMREDLGHGLFLLHIARNKRQARHFIAFQVRRTARTISVLRILHDSMDLKRHLAQPDDPTQES